MKTVIKDESHIVGTYNCMTIANNTNKYFWTNQVYTQTAILEGGNIFEVLQLEDAPVEVRRDMLVEVLTIEELRDMLYGTNPSLYIIESMKKLGTYSDLSGWLWYKKEIEKLSKEIVYQLYLICKKSCK